MPHRIGAKTLTPDGLCRADHPGGLRGWWAMDTRGDEEEGDFAIVLFRHEGSPEQVQ